MAKASKSQDTETISSSASDQQVVQFSDGPYPSELFPERAAGDVDVANIKDPDKEYKGEKHAPLNLETWVVLDGTHKEVPKELDGKLAAVIAYPTTTEQDPDTGETSSYLPPKASITVKVRDQGQILHLPMDAFKSVHLDGRAGALNFA